MAAFLTVISFHEHGHIDFLTYIYIITFHFNYSRYSIIGHTFNPRILKVYDDEGRTSCHIWLLGLHMYVSTSSLSLLVIQGTWTATLTNDAILFREVDVLRKKCQFFFGQWFQLNYLGHPSYPLLDKESCLSSADENRKEDLHL